MLRRACTRPHNFASHPLRVCGRAGNPRASSTHCCGARAGLAMLMLEACLDWIALNLSELKTVHAQSDQGCCYCNTTLTSPRSPWVCSTSSSRCAWRGTSTAASKMVRTCSTLTLRARWRTVLAVLRQLRSNRTEKIATAAGLAAALSEAWPEEPRGAAGGDGPAAARRHQHRRGRGCEAAAASRSSRTAWTSSTPPRLRASSAGRSCWRR